MKDTFKEWKAVSTMDIDEVSNLILTGRKASEAKPDDWVVKLVGDDSKTIRVLDFGCGFGRNAFGWATMFPQWSVVAYDSEEMIQKTDEYHGIHYAGPKPVNLEFMDDWEQVSQQKFDVIYCVLVLQHIYEDALKKYLADFKQMTDKLVVSGRRFNDDRNRSTWEIMEEAGYFPSVFYKGLAPVFYTSRGDPEDHNVAVYLT